MGKLAHLMPKEEQPVSIKQDLAFVSSLSKMLQNVAEFSEIAPEMREGLASQVAEAKRIQSGLTASQSALEGAIKAAVKSMAADLEKVSKRVDKGLTSEDFGKMQARLIDALSQVQIPDYSEQLARLEAKKVDLKSIEAKLDQLLAMEEMDEEEPPKQWRFEIERNANGTIKSVDAVEV